MIPKRLFFIWVGDDRSVKMDKYIHWSMDEYKKMNPELEIIFYDIPDVEKSQNDDVIEFRRLRDEYHNIPKENTHVSAHEYHRAFGNLHYHDAFKERLKFGDGFKFYLLNKYGGIYLDCDTYPIKPFDDDFFNADVQTLDFDDLFFLAAQPNILQQKYIKQKMYLREQFYMLHFSDPQNRISKDVYFKHDSWRTWLKDNIKQIDNNI